MVSGLAGCSDRRPPAMVALSATTPQKKEKENNFLAWFFVILRTSVNPVNVSESCERQ